MLRILDAREVRRLQKNPTALMLIGLLAAVALLMATSRPVTKQIADRLRGSGSSTFIGLRGSNTLLRTCLSRSRSSRWLVKTCPVRIGMASINRWRTRPVTTRSQCEWHLTKMASRSFTLSGDFPATIPRCSILWAWFWPTTTSAFIQGAKLEQHVVPRRRAPEVRRADL